MQAIVPETVTPVDLTICDHPPPLTDFNGAAYMGQWFEQVHVKHEFFQPDNSVCATANYSDLQSDGHFVVYNTY